MEALLGFNVDMGIRGLWVGYGASSCILTTLYYVIIYNIDWPKAAEWASQNEDQSVSEDSSDDEQSSDVEENADNNPKGKICNDQANCSENSCLLS